MANEPQAAAIEPGPDDPTACPWCYAPRTATAPLFDAGDPWTLRGDQYQMTWACGTDGQSGEAADRTALCREREAAHDLSA
jgi:hypothetical protein